MFYIKDHQINKIPSIQGKVDFKEKCQEFRESLFPSPLEAPEPN